jgi:hypothetical protein
MSDQSVRLVFSEDSIESGARDLSKLLDDPTRALSELTIHATETESWEREDGLAPIVAAIAERMRPSLRKLALYGNSSDLLVFSDDDMPVDLGPLGALWARLPALEQLALHSMVLDVGRLHIDTVRDAEISVGMPQEAGFVDALAAASWPKLERLVLDLGDPQFTSSDATADDLVRILGRMPRLRQLGLLGFCPIDDFVAWLVSSPLAGQLETLALVQTPFSDDGAQTLLRARPAFRNLQRLRLPGSHDVSIGLRAELNGFCPDAFVDDHSDWDEWRAHI